MNSHLWSVLVSSCSLTYRALEVRQGHGICGKAECLGREGEGEGEGEGASQGTWLGP